MSDKWTGKLSEYLDDELSSGERDAVESHLATCAECAGTLEALRRVVASAQALRPRPPATDLWEGIASRTRLHDAVAASRQARKISFTLPQLAAASILLAAVSAGIAWQFSFSTSASPAAPPAMVFSDEPSPGIGIQPASLADQEYDAAVEDLEKALHDGRGVLDATTIAILEQNLAIINVAIEQARQALEADPANGYLSSHLVQARRKKLELLRQAAALAAEADQS